MRLFALCISLGLFLTVLVFPVSPLHAAIFKWKDDQGKVHYTNDKSKIPRKYREKGEMGKLRDSGAKPGAATSPVQKSHNRKGAKILTEEELSKIETAKEFLNKESDFVNLEETSFHTPTGLRAFGNKYTALNQERATVKQQISGTRVPALKKVEAHIESSLKAAEENPNWMRKLSVANTVKRLKQEVSSNGGLIASLDEAVKKSKEKEEELKKKKEEKKNSKKD